MKLKTFVLGSLAAGAMLLSTGLAVAENNWHWSAQDHHWDHRADLQSDRNDLAEARQQLNYDTAHHASRKKLAEDNARIEDILNSMKHHKH